MKPAFALSFSENGISLHHQSDDEWYCIGTVPLDTPDLSEQMQALRDQGFALANHLGCRLVIPPDQVRLLTVQTDGLDPDAAAQKVQETLAEATPYALSELAYTAKADGTVTEVAAVARQTLNEARDFAIAHGFLPEMFCAGAEGQDALAGPAFEWVDGESETTVQAEDVPTVPDNVAIETPKPLEEPAIEPSGPPEEPVTEALEPTDEPVSETLAGPEDPQTDSPETSEEPVAEVLEITEEIAAETPVLPEGAPTDSLETQEAPETEALEPSGDLATETPALTEDTPTESSETQEEPASEAADTSKEGPVETRAQPEDPVAESPEATAVEPSIEDEPQAPVHPIAEPANLAAFRAAPQVQPAPRSWGGKRLAIPAVAASIFLGMALGAWSIMGPDPAPEKQVEAQPAPDPQPPAPETDIAVVEPEPIAPEPAQQPEETTPATEPPDDLSATDAAILEALLIEPEAVDSILPDDEPLNLFKDFTGTAPVTPPVLAAPQPDQTSDIYLASIDRSDLSQDAVALPAVDSLNTDQPFDQVALPVDPGTQFELDERGLVSASPDGTLNPDGVMVYQGRPSSVPPEPPVRFEEEPDTVEVDERLAGFRPRPRPDNLVDQFERSQLGGRSLEELAVVRPKLRPETLKVEPEIDYTPTALAVVRVPRPKTRPGNLAPRTASAPSAGTATLGSTANVGSASDEAGSFQPRTVAPKIPTTASVARQATIDNAINLRRLNLIGVYGTPANRRALVRLPSGRYKKLKVGDRLDGGKVVAIGDSELRYQKRGKNVTLKMPRG